MMSTMSRASQQGNGNGSPATKEEHSAEAEQQRKEEDRLDRVEGRIETGRVKR